MKQEYFMQIKIDKKDEKSGLLDRIKETLGDGTKYYTDPWLIAKSAGAGFCLDYLRISPQLDKDDKSGECMWYTFKITDFTYKQKESDLDKLVDITESLFKSKLGEVHTGYFFRVSATDVPEDWDMITQCQDCYK